MPVATAYTAVEIADDAHFAARHDLVGVDDPVLGAVAQQAPYPRLVGEERARADRGTLRSGRTTTRCGAPWSGLSPDELDALRAKGVV